MFRLVSIYKGRKHVEPVAVTRSGLCAPQALNLF
jgi:hypothetical protein